MLENNIFELKNHDFRSNSKWGHFFHFLEKDQAEDGVQTIRPMTQTARTIRTAVTDDTDQFDIPLSIRLEWARYDNSYQ